MFNKRLVLVRVAELTDDFGPPQSGQHARPHFLMDPLILFQLLRLEANHLTNSDTLIGRGRERRLLLWRGFESLGLHLRGC